MTPADFKERAWELINDHGESEGSYVVGGKRLAEQFAQALADVDAKARAEALAGTEDNPFEPGTWGEEVWQKGRNAGYEQGVWESAEICEKLSELNLTSKAYPRPARTEGGKEMKSPMPRNRSWIAKRGECGDITILADINDAGKSIFCIVTDTSYGSGELRLRQAYEIRDWLNRFIAWTEPKENDE